MADDGDAAPLVVGDDPLDRLEDGLAEGLEVEPVAVPVAAKEVLPLLVAISLVLLVRDVDRAVAVELGELLLVGHLDPRQLR